MKEEPAPPPVPSPADSSTSSVYVAGFGFKGEGKNANYGVAIAPPALVAEVDLPPGVQQPSSASGPQGGDYHPSVPSIPPPIAATTEMVEQWISEGFQRLTNLSNKQPPEVGESVLWRGVKTGKRGHPSTKVEFFHGKVRGLSLDDQSHELYIYID